MARDRRDDGHGSDGAASDPLMVQSVEKAFRLLNAFDRSHRSLSLAQLTAIVGLDKSATQRFAHTLTRLGYLEKDPQTKRFALTVKTLDIGNHYIRANILVERAMPYLLHLSQATEETVNLTVLDDTDIVFVARFLSRHILNADVVVGTRIPAFCTAPGMAMLSRLPRDQAVDRLSRSPLQAFTPHTTHTMDSLLAKLDRVREAGYATAWEEFLPGDLSVATAVLDHRGHPVAAVNVAGSRTRFTPDEVEAAFAPLVKATAASVSDFAPAP